MKTPTTRSIVRIPLREVDGNGVHPSEHEDAPKGSPIMNAIHNVMVPVHGGRKLIEDSTFEGRKTGRLTSSQYPIPAQDQKAAERIAAAVQRAVKLCGGQVDVF